MGERRQGHTDLAPAVVVGAPVASWIVALGVLHGDGGGWVYAMLFLVAPFAMSLAVLRFAGARTAAIPAAIVSSALGGASWLAAVLLFAAKVAG
jgi:hypothetical protein